MVLRLFLEAADINLYWIMLIFPFILLDFASYNPAAYLCFVFLQQPKKYVGVFLNS